MSVMTSPPDVIPGGLSVPPALGIPPSASTVSNFSFVPIGATPPPTASCTPLVRPVASPPSLIKRKNTTDTNHYGTAQESGYEGPQRKVHLNEELVSRTMADLYISHPRAKVARREVNCDVAEAMNLNGLEDLESKFSNQASITNEEFHLPPQRSRKLPTRTKVPQLRLSIHQELKNLRSSNAILPESIMSRYRPSLRSTAVVLWKPPPTGFLNGVHTSKSNTACVPDVVTSALRSVPSCGRQRTRCYSEVTSTPYSSHENLSCDSDMPDISEGNIAPGFPLSHASNLATTPPGGCAEAPELSNDNGEVSDHTSKQ
jgi:hypothetical protein